MSKDTGGFAFPTHFDGMQAADHGMTLRDYFAAKALNEIRYDSVHFGTVRTDPAGIASYCYEIADAMIAERAK